jgi:hypothetical protein
MFTYSAVTATELAATDRSKVLYNNRLEGPWDNAKLYVYLLAASGLSYPDYDGYVYNSQVLNFIFVSSSQSRLSRGWFV